MVSGHQSSRPYEGRIRPSLIAATSSSRTTVHPAAYEGRIRPSLIAACEAAEVEAAAAALRGANSPLPHCGPTKPGLPPPPQPPYEGRIRPSLIAAYPAASPPRQSAGYEGRIRPSLIAAYSQTIQTLATRRLRGANSPLPHCGTDTAGRSTVVSCATRGEFAPPSLRREVAGVPGRRVPAYEGRIRPSLIAAPGWEPGGPNPAVLRGANSPLPHCGSPPKP